MRRLLFAWCFVALGAVTLTACSHAPTPVPVAQSSGVPASPSTAPGPASAAAVPAPTAISPSASPSRTAAPPIVVNPPKPVESGAITIAGRIYAGAEPSCLLINEGKMQYLLLGGDPTQLRAGARVLVTGHVVQGVATHCMQGRPFQVTQVEALTP